MRFNREKIAIVSAIDYTLRVLLTGQIKAIQHEGFEVHGVCSRGRDFQMLREMGVLMSSVRNKRSISPFSDLAALWRMYRYFKRQKISIVHTHTPKATLLGQLAAKLAGVPIIVNTIHGFYFHEHMKPLARRFYIAMEWIAARCSTMILCQNPEDIETAVKLGICKRNKIKLLGNGVDLSIFDPVKFDNDFKRKKRSEIGVPEEAVVVGIIGRLVKEKGETRQEKYREFHKKGFFPTEELPENQPPMTLRTAINYSLFDIYMMTEDVILFGEDVADFAREYYEKGEEAMNKLKGKGGVFLATKNLQRAFGPERTYNTQLDEAGILGRAVGHSYQGRIPLPEIQFIDYMSPAYQQLKDRIATTYQRSNALVRTPMVIRTSYGGYKQGAGAMWHSEANLGTYINIPGLHVVIPSNAADAAGLMRTAFVCGDPVLFCEAVALYNRRDWDGYNIMAKYPPLEKLIPFGEAEVYNKEAEDIAIISYGITLPICLRVMEQLAEKNISARVIDLRTVKPIDWETIKETVEQCSKVLIVSEDRFYGGVGPTIAGYIGDHLFDYLDAPVKIITSKDARVAYGDDGDRICIPQQDDILQEAIDLAGY